MSGLRARRNQRGTGTEVATTTPDTGAQTQEQTQTQPEQQEQTQAQTNTQAAPPATKPAGAVRTGRNSEMVDLNAGILENIEDMDIGGNFVSIDGSEFLYKATNETAKELDIVVAAGKRFYQWYDEENERYENSDTKLDDRFKFKFEIRWFEPGEEGEPVEYIMSLPTASAMNFVAYVKGLAKQGLGVGQVITRMTLSRQTRKGTNDRFSRVEFANIGLAE